MITEINQAMQSIWSNSIGLEIIRTIIPVGCVLLGFWLKGWETKNELRRKYVDVILIEVELLVAAGSLYWRTTSTTPKDEAEVALEAEIQGRLHAVNALFEDLAKEFTGSHVSDVRTSISELRQILTSGQFAAPTGHVSSSIAISRSFSVAAELRVRLEACLRQQR